MQWQGLRVWTVVLMVGGLEVHMITERVAALELLLLQSDCALTRQGALLGFAAGEKDECRDGIVTGDSRMRMVT